jgi:ABC-2 type transport system ATP-binding protein
MRIEIHDVTKRFGAARALNGLSLRIEAGERVGLIGPNGSGKSTLLRALLGLIACEGTILVDGRSPFDQRIALAARLAYVPQTAPNWGAPVGEVVESVVSLRRIDGARVAEVAMRLGLDLAAIGTRPLRNLSGGMKQKVLIALALSSDASLFILDEPTASLDLDARERFFALLDEMSPNATRIFCSHRHDEFDDQVERIVALADGAVEFDGSVASHRARTAERSHRAARERVVSGRSGSPAFEPALRLCAIEGGAS